MTSPRRIGRPRRAGGPSVRVWTSLRPKDHAWLKRHARGDIASFLRALVEAERLREEEITREASAPRSPP